jgi:FMN phosphatase YigB (HAD superfamily)
MDYEAVLFDFDGVLCRGRFYEKTLLPAHKKIYEWIQKNIFGNKELVRKWMRNRIVSAEINELISKSTGIEYELLDQLYKKSVNEMILENDIMDLVRSLKLSGKKIGIVTDNMDIFSEIVIKKNRLDKIFDIVINSADYGVLKKDQNGKLFDIALFSLNEKIENSLLIDDSRSVVELYERKGGHGFVYKNFSGLKSFLRIRKLEKGI